MRVPVLCVLVFMLAVSAACAARFPVTVTDARGAKITIPKEPKRIISLAPSNTEILFELGVGNRVVGVTRKCDYPAAARKIPQVGDVLISIERVMSLRPDLVVAHGNLNAAVIPQLERRGVTVVAVDPQSFAGLCRDITTIGRAVGASRAADKVCRKINDAVRRAKERAKTFRHAPRTLIVITEWPAWVAGTGIFLDEMISVAGGSNAGSGIMGYGQMSIESMVMRAPEVIVVLTGGKSDFFTRAATRVTPAVRRGRCTSLEPELFVRTGPRLVEGLAKLSDIMAAAAEEER